MKHLSCKETMMQIVAWLKEKQPFLHTRFNDGEWNAMFNMKKESETTSREHHYSKSICTELLQTFEEISERIQTDPRHILVGSNHHIEGYLDSGTRFIQYLATKPGLEKITRWCAGDVWYTTEDERLQTVDSKGTIKLLDELRNGGHRVVFVCNQIVKDACYSMNADKVILIPQTDAWKESRSILWKCSDVAVDRPTVFVWCGGFPTKIWSWEIYKQFPNSSHIDLGHLFDGVFGQYNRGWLQRQESEPPNNSHWRFLQNVFKPYILGCIPCQR